MRYILFTGHVATSFKGFDSLSAIPYTFLEA